VSEPLEEREGGEPERPDYLLDRFNTVDDQARSYAELEASYTRGQQELRGLQEAYQDLAGQIEELQEAQYQAYQEPQEQAFDPAASPMLAMLEQARENGDLQTELAIQAAMQRGLWEHWQAEQAQAQEPDQNQEVVSQLFAMQTEQLLRQSVPDWDEIKTGVHDLIQANEYLLTDTPEPIVAANQVRNAIAIYRQQQAELAAQNGTQPVYDPGRQQKLQAQGLQGQGLNPGTEMTSEQYADYVRSQRLEGFKL
jgi:hypothetical protein